jgi:hypothetical protein
LLKTFVKKQILDKHSVTHIDIWCEYKWDNKIFRSHPNYRGGGPWLDWCIIEFERSDIDKRRILLDKQMGALTAYPPGHYPAKILGFFKEPVQNGQWMCIIHTCCSKVDSSEDSCLIERWSREYENKKIIRKELVSGNVVREDRPHEATYVKEPLLRIAPCGSIRDRVYVIEQSVGFAESITMSESEVVVLVKKRSQWPKYFTAL